MILAEIDLNTLLAGSSGFALATIFFVIVIIRYVMPAFLVREEKREAVSAELSKQVGEVVHVVNTLVIKVTDDAEGKFEKLHALLAQKHEQENSAHRGQ